MGADLAAVAVAFVIFAGCVAAALHRLRRWAGYRLAAALVVGVVVLAAGGQGRTVEPTAMLLREPTGGLRSW